MYDEENQENDFPSPPVVSDPPTAGTRVGRFFRAAASSVTSSFTRLRESRRPNDKKIAEAKKRKTLKRQRNLERSEIKQSWKFVFGESTEGMKNSEIFQIENLTLRDIWMESNFLYNQILKFRTDETFHSIENYALLWKVS